MIIHATIYVDEDLAAVRDGARRLLGTYLSTLLYSQVSVRAGFAGILETGWIDEMLGAVVIAGDEESVFEQWHDTSPGERPRSWPPSSPSETTRRRPPNGP